MSAWKRKRFWSEGAVAESRDGFEILLDGRALKTPAKAGLILPTRAYADAVLAEWMAQQDEVNPVTMPVTRSANSAIDKVRVQFDEVVGLLADYGGSDLLCYRATDPEPLRDLQAKGWDPLLRWAAEELNAPLNVGSGVMYIAQPEESLVALRHHVEDLSPFALAAFHDLVGISGSLVLALATTKGHLSAAAAWDISRIDELWQIEQWGEDEEAAETAQKKRQEFLEAHRIFLLT